METITLREKSVKMKLNNNKYTLFIDESGVGNLNHPGKYFVLSCILVKNENIPTIEGYFGLSKQEYLRDRKRNIHTTDLFERTYLKYRKLQKPKDRRNAFFEHLTGVMKILPFKTALYLINKDILRNKLSYKPYKGKQSFSINRDLPYELASRNAILDFVYFLRKNHSFGEIVIESRQFSDQLFVSYFDDIRKTFFPGKAQNPYFKDSRERINSLTISNKDYVHTGLEIADIGAYTTYRKNTGDPFNKMCGQINFSNGIYNVIKKKNYIISNRGGSIIKITETKVNDVKPSKLF